MFNYEELKEKYEWFDFVYQRYISKFDDKEPEDFVEDLERYNQIPIFKANENIHEIMTDYSNRDNLPDIEEKFVKSTDIVTPGSHWIMRMITQYYITKAFEAMKIDMKDPNIAENSLGKGTPGRISKCWCGDNPEDTTEFLSSRWNTEPYVSCFPNEDNNKSIITKEVDIIACCSHHFLPFSTLDGGKAIISYIPDKYVLGISKLQRIVNFYARRGWLQEDLTSYIGKQLVRILGTPDVYIKIENAVHGCEKFRGTMAKNGNLTTEFRSGYFKNHNISG